MAAIGLAGQVELHGADVAAVGGTRDPEAPAAVFERRRHALPVRPCLFGAEWRQEAHGRAAAHHVLEQDHESVPPAEHLLAGQRFDTG